MISSKNSELPLTAIFALLSMLLLGACRVQTTTESDADTTSAVPTIRDYLEMTGSSAGWDLPDGARLFLSRGSGEVAHLHLEQGDRVRTITDGPEPIERYTVNPSGTALLFLSAKGGDEQYDITLLSLTNGERKSLLADPTVRYDSPLWIDDTRFLYTANEVSKRDFYLYLYDTVTGKRRLLADREGTHVIVDAKSADQFLFYTMLGSTVTVPYRYENGKVHKFKGARDDRYYRPIGYWHDGRILTITDDETDSAELAFYDTKGKKERIFSDRFPVEEALLDRTSRDEAVFCVNEEGWSTCYHFFRNKIAPLDLGKGVITLDHFSAGKITYTLSSPNAIPRPIRYDLRSGERRAFGLTDPHGVPVERFVTPEVRKVVSFDGEKIPYLLYRPRDTDTPYRTIVYFHGGPEGQSRPSFAPVFQYYLSRGFAIVLPNVRGSTGYGRRFSDLDNYKKRMDAVKDVEPILDDLVRSGISRPDRFVAWGGSYGGFMTVASMAWYPERFRCGVDVVGVVDFVNFLKNTKSYRKALREAEYGPLEDEEFLRSISPTTMADRITGRIFIAHGANDPRVPVTDAYLLAEQLRALGSPPDMLIFDDEGHGFRKKKNRIRFNEQAGLFIEGCATNR